MSWAEWAADVEIEPSIYASDFSRLGVQLEALHDAGARIFHFDVGDGHFISEITIGPIVLASISPLVRGWGARLDCHLMVDEPERHFDAIASAGGDSVTFHVEACDDPRRAIAAARSLDLGVGVALNPETPVDAVLPHLAAVDLALVMSVHPGFGGQQFIDGALEKIRVIRKALDSLHLSAELEVDGGIKPSNAARIVRAGATVLVAGSAIFEDPDGPSAALRKFKQAIPG
jgi:ribulose-phosphate 3-epimerase